MSKAIIYIHGKGGSASEAEYFQKLCHGYDVVGVDYSGNLPWTVPTAILYAGRDNLTARCTVDEFVSHHSASLTVMENGEHWFHTKEQLAFLDQWIKKEIAIDAFWGEGIKND